MNMFIIALFIAGAVAAPNAYYGQPQPDIRVESYTMAPPVATQAPIQFNPPMEHQYGYYQALPATTQPPPANPPMEVHYGYYPAAVATTQPPPPASPPVEVNYGYQPTPSILIRDVPRHTFELAPPPAVVFDVPRNSYGQQATFVKTLSAPTATIVRQVVRTDNAGTYQMNVESSDGSSHTESGSLRDLGHPEGPAAIKAGSYSFSSPEGKRFTVTYTADENGFVAKGDHLPTSPPIPEEIRKSLELPRVREHNLAHSYGY